MSAANPQVNVTLGESNVRNAIAGADLETLRAGVAWYGIVRAECHVMAKEFGVPFRVIAGIVAVLSATAPWEQNKVATRRILESWHSGTRNAEDMPAVVRNHLAVVKAVLMLQTGKVAEHIVKVAPTYRTQSWKTLVFWYNISGKSTRRVTIDVWMWRLISGDMSSQKRPKGCEYMVCERIVQKVAREFGLRPCDAQAVAWMTLTGKVA